MKKIHYRLLKDYLDEIIINKGYIQVENPEKVIEKIKVDFLVKLAFSFYRKLYDHEVKSIYVNKWEWFRCISCKTPCDDIHIYQNSPDLNISDIICPYSYNKCEVECLNCNKKYISYKPENSEMYMPVCDECFDAIGQEMEIWQRLFD